MLVQRILVFIKNLKSIKNLRPCDHDFVIQLSKKFVDQSQLAKPDVTKDIPYLLKCFEERWNKIIDLEDNYLQRPNERANQEWISLARDLALSELSLQKSYLKILMPTITNDNDFNNYSTLSTISGLNHLYLGNDNETLYEKKGLCKNLIEHNYILCTHRTLSTGQLTTLSINELTRLESCDKDIFSIESETFNNFWDFLKKKVFIQLQKQGKIPIDLLPHFLELINDYFIDKNSGLSYLLFRKKLKNFFNMLYQNKLEDINYFYGIKIRYGKKEYYLVELLIIMNRTQGFVLDNHFNAILKWLYANYTSLNLVTPKLELLSAEVKLITTPAVVQKAAMRQEQCLGLLLSLFTTKFNYLPFSGGKVIKVWDIANSVVFDAGEIFSLFEPLLIGEFRDIEQLLTKYDKAIEKYITPGRFDDSYATQLTRWENVTKWYVQAYEKTLAPWYPPEQLISALLQATHPAGNDFKKRINAFLDQLIHIHIQNKPKLLRELKINVQFFEFFNNLSGKEQAYLQFLIHYQNTTDFKSSFLANCQEHLVNRLVQIIPLVKTTKKPQFFPSAHHLDRSKLVFPLHQFDTLNKLIDALKIKVESSEFNLDANSLNKLLSYIRKLTCPIWAIDGSEEIHHDDPTLYMGGFI